MPKDIDRSTPIPAGMGRLLYKIISTAIMSQGRLPRFPLLGCLLIVLAIQGIVPDAHDLASMQPLRLLAGVPPESASLNQEDEWPDDVCDPMTTSSTVGRPESHRLDEEYSPFYGRTNFESWAAPHARTQFCFRARLGHRASFAKPLCTIGCLLC
jgi:hypothetical protein